MYYSGLVYSVFLEFRGLFFASNDIFRKPVQKNAAHMIAQPEHEYCGDESAKREHEGDRDRIGCKTSEYADDRAYRAERSYREYGYKPERGYDNADSDEDIV